MKSQLLAVLEILRSNNPQNFKGFQISKPELSTFHKKLEKSKIKKNSHNF